VTVTKLEQSVADYLKRLRSLNFSPVTIRNNTFRTPYLGSAL